MTDKQKTIFKEVLIVLAVGVVAYVVYCIYKAIKAGVSDVASLIKAPFTALSSAWSAVTNLFSSPAVATPQPVAIVDNTGQTVGTVQPSSPLYGLLAPQDQADTQTITNTLLGTTPAPPSRCPSQCATVGRSTPL